MKIIIQYILQAVEINKVIIFIFFILFFFQSITVALSKTSTDKKKNICLTKSTDFYNLDFQRDNINYYPIRVWINEENTPVYSCFSSNRKIIKYLSFSKCYKIVENNYRIKKKS